VQRKRCVHFCWDKRETRQGRSRPTDRDHSGTKTTDAPAFTRMRGTNSPFKSSRANSGCRHVCAFATGCRGDGGFILTLGAYLKLTQNRHGSAWTRTQRRRVKQVRRVPAGLTGSGCSRLELLIQTEFRSRPPLV